MVLNDPEWYIAGFSPAFRAIVFPIKAGHFTRNWRAY